MGGSEIMVMGVPTLSPAKKTTWCGVRVHACIFLSLFSAFLSEGKAFELA